MRQVDSELRLASAKYESRAREGGKFLALCAHLVHACARQETAKDNASLASYLLLQIFFLLGWFHVTIRSNPSK